MECSPWTCVQLGTLVAEPTQCQVWAYCLCTKRVLRFIAKNPEMMTADCCFGQLWMLRSANRVIVFLIGARCFSTALSLRLL